MDSFDEESIFENAGGDPEMDPATSNITQNDTANKFVMDAFAEEWTNFRTFWHRTLSVYQPLEMGVVAAGLLGNLLALLTLLRSRKMNASPSFVYHRVLVTADLLFCVNYFMHLLVSHTLTVTCHQTFYKYYAGAFFDGVVHHVINHVCSYVIMYMTLVIALDRFVALALFEKFRIWNTMRVAYTVSLVSLVLSAAAHSWAAFAQNTVVAYRLKDSGNLATSIVDEPCWTEPVVYHWTKRDNVTGAFKAALVAKEYVNGFVRIAYPILLCTLTLIVLVSFARRQKKRRANAATVPSEQPTASSNLSNGILKRTSTVSQRKFSSISVAYSERGSIFSGFSFNFLGINFKSGQRSQSTSDRILSPAVRHKQRCERTLFYLMISVVILAFIQVASSESRRILYMIFPPYEYLTKNVVDDRLPLDERLANFRFLLYGHQATRILANFCTAVDRSFICFLYVAMNNVFRRELLALMYCRRCATAAGLRYGFFRDRCFSADSAVLAHANVPAKRSNAGPPASPVSPAVLVPCAPERGYASSPRLLAESMTLLTPRPRSSFDFSFA